METRLAKVPRIYVHTDDQKSQPPEQLGSVIKKADIQTDDSGPDWVTDFNTSIHAININEFEMMTMQSTSIVIHSSYPTNAPGRIQSNPPCFRPSHHQSTIHQISKFLVKTKVKLV